MRLVFFIVLEERIGSRGLLGPEGQIYVIRTFVAFVLCEALPALVKENVNFARQVVAICLSLLLDLLEALFGNGNLLVVVGVVGARRANAIRRKRALLRWLRCHVGSVLENRFLAEEELRVLCLIK